MSLFGRHYKYRNLMDDMGMGAHHVSAATLPRIRPPLDDLFDNHEQVRETITRNVSAARQLIRVKIQALPQRG